MPLAHTRSICQFSNSNGETLTAIHVNADGTIVLGSDRLIRRLLPNGSRDRRFGGGDGSFPTESGRFAVDPLGRILTLGGESVRRYHVEGTPDRRWGKNGAAKVYSLAGHAFRGEISAVVFQPGARVVALASEFQGLDSPATFIGLSPRGRVDATFGNNGVAAAGSSRGFKKLVVGSDGIILSVGNTDDADTFLVRYFADGRADESFSNNYLGGIKLTADHNYIVSGLLVQPDGRIVLTGRGSQRQRDGELFYGAVVYRVNADGTEDSSFHYDGRADFGHLTYDNNFYPTAAVMGHDGAMFVAGIDYHPFSEQPAVGFNLAKIDLSGAAPPFSSLARQTLRIYGTIGPDRIEVTQDPADGSLFVKLNGDGQIVDVPVRKIIIDAGAGDDRIYVSTSIRTTTMGGTGDDYIAVFGPGVVSGGRGRDSLDGDEASQDFHGGDGFDVVTYSGATEDLVIRLDNRANDGQHNERDNVRSDVEGVIGGDGNDLIIGNPSFNLLVGNRGDDTLWGGDGDDTLRGGLGADLLMGQDGTDDLQEDD